MTADTNSGTATSHAHPNIAIVHSGSGHQVGSSNHMANPIERAAVDNSVETEHQDALSVREGLTRRIRFIPGSIDHTGRKKTVIDVSPYSHLRPGPTYLKFITEKPSVQPSWIEIDISSAITPTSPYGSKGSSGSD